MLKELRLLLGACGPEAGMEEFRTAIMERNVLLKRTLATRKESVRRLRELYGLSPHVLVFRALRDVWRAGEQAQPLLALLCAVGRDPILRATADLILSCPVGEAVTPHMISASVAEAFPGRYNSTTLANIGRHAASSWQQSGHLTGKLKKTRSQAQSTPAVVAYAALLGYICGARGNALFQTLWTQLLDSPEHMLRDQAFAASQRGWMEYKHTGGVTEITFRFLLRKEDGRTCPE